MEPARPATVFAMAPVTLPRLLDADATVRLRRVSDIDLDVIVTDFADPDPVVSEALDGVEVLFTCWGVRRLDAAALERMPKVRAVVHAAGSVKGFITDQCWERGIRVSSAVSANAIPVAEYTIAMILLAGKRAYQIAGEYRAGKGRGPSYVGDVTVGNFGARIGVVGASRVGRAVLELLRPYDVEVLLADPTIDADEAAALGAELVELDLLVARSDVVTIHAPDVPATRQMFDARRLGLLRDGATLINTARGRLIDTAALTAELTSGRIFAVLDVTDPEPLPADSPLFGLPNVWLTPHIAGSQGNEIRRMGALAVSELERYVAGMPFAHEVLREHWDVLA